MKLNEEQKYVIKELMMFRKPVTTLGGFGGAGKSTVIRHLVELLPKFAVCAYTGKAAKVMGLPVNPEILVGALVPFVAAAVWLGLRRMHHKLHAD